jgi:glutamyl-tRNA synthetase
MIKTRFAPSPTGYLHLGGARTALFNWLFAQKNNGVFYLRIDDTDKKRSKEIFLDDIKANLSKLGLTWHNSEIYQSQNISSHLAVTAKMLENGSAYYCCASRTEIDDFQKNNPGKKFVSPYREQSIGNKSDSVLRLKVPLEGNTYLQDNVLGKVSVKNSQIDDLVLVRSDGSPTYILSSAVDDYDMQITDVIRGNDHLTNTFKQLHIIEAMGWDTPNFSHIPLIMNKAGQKLSKRDGNFGLGHYLEQGYLPDALNNYLLRLGWSHGDEEIISIDQAKQIFSLAAINKSPAKFDVKKLNHINQAYLKNTDDDKLYPILQDKLELTDVTLQERIKKALPFIKERGQTILEIVKLGQLYIESKNSLDETATEVLQGEGLKVLGQLNKELQACQDWKTDIIKDICQNFASKNNLKTPQIMKPLRAGIFGTFQSPPLFESMQVLGQKEVLKRLSYHQSND